MISMTNEELKIKIGELLPTAAFEEPADPKSGGWLTINISPGDWATLSKQLRETDALTFDYLFCLTCIDWKTHLTMVYHLSSTIYRHTIVVKSTLEITQPQIETCTGIWKTAEFHEREVYEMFGVNFLNHPDLRLLILPDGWENRNPMRKDFEDPVNMIRL
jgi:NADH-quinone oxidoreductase subunit C